MGSPFASGALQTRKIRPSPSVPVGANGVVGADFGTNGVVVLALGPLPAAFTARKVKVYSTPLVSPFTVTGEVALVAV